MRVDLAVAGAHLRGQPLHHQLTDRDASFVRASRTSNAYRLYALDTTPHKPGLVRGAPGTGAPISIEIYSLPVAGFGEFVSLVPPPLCIGRVQLASGGDVAGFLCEAVGIYGAADITAFGGWVKYLNSLTSPT